MSELPGMLHSMARVHLQAADDHVAALAHERDPVRAVVELVWNAVDAAGREGLDRLGSDETRARITSIFAPYLIAHRDIEFIYDGSRIDPSSNIASDQMHPITWIHNGVEHEALLRVIEWAEGGERA